MLVFFFFSNDSFDKKESQYWTFLTHSLFMVAVGHKQHVLVQACLTLYSGWEIAWVWKVVFGKFNYILKVASTCVLWKRTTFRLHTGALQIACSFLIYFWHICTLCCKCLHTLRVWQYESVMKYNLCQKLRDI